LSDLLEPPECVPEKYYLSATACRGILRRAEKRGKVLPPLLDIALRSQLKRAEAEEEG
jgi:DNA (cytosine-5)-methyltransferase 1